MIYCTTRIFHWSPATSSFSSEAGDVIIMKEPDPLQQVDRTYVLYQKRKFSYFAGCDYFRLSSHPKITRAVTDGLKAYGLNVAASRITTGNHAVYHKVEAMLARFFDTPAALFVGNGYSTNSIAAAALRGDFSHAFIDAKAHLSLRDAGKFLECPVIEFKSRDVADLQRAMAGAGGNIKPIVLTDGVFTFEGEVAPVREYLKIIGPRGMVLLDDAHGAGVIGPTGRGTPEFEKVSRERVVQTATLSKAFGVYGGAILCSRALRDKMIANSPQFAGSTPLPLPLVNAAASALNLLNKDRGFLNRLNGNVHYIKTTLRDAGFSTPLTTVPVVAISPKTPADSAALRKRLIAHKIFPSFIKYPGGPAAGYYRFVISSEHSQAQLDNLLAALAK